MFLTGSFCIRFFFSNEVPLYSFSGEVLPFLQWRVSLTHCCVLLSFSFQTGTLWLAENFCLGFSALCGFPKIQKTRKQNKQTIKKTHRKTKTSVHHVEVAGLTSRLTSQLLSVI